MFSSICDNDFAEERSTRFTAWNNETRQAHREKFPRIFAVDGKGLVVWCVTPDVAEGEAGKFTSPTESGRNSTDKGQDHVTNVESGGEAFVSAAPNAIMRVCTFRLGQYVFIGYLKRERIALVMVCEMITCIATHCNDDHW